MTDTLTDGDIAFWRADLDACEREAAINAAAKKVAEASAKYHAAFTSPVEIEEDIERLGRLWEVAIREYLALTEKEKNSL